MKIFQIKAGLEQAKSKQAASSAKAHAMEKTAGSTNRKISVVQKEQAEHQRA